MTYSKRFCAAVDFVFKHECEYDARGNVRVEDVPGDSGGLTKYGIDAASHPNVDIANLTREGAMEIYYNSYWCPTHAEELNAPIGEFMFDTAVNNGPRYAVKALQKVLGVNVDGVIGPATLQAANSSNPQELFTKLISARNEHYHSIVNSHPKDAKFLNGWLNRTKDLLAFGNTVGERREEAIA